MPKPATDASWDVEVSEKAGRPIRWNGQNFQYYKQFMEIAARKKSTALSKVMAGEKKYDENFTNLQKEAWEGWQLDLQELIFSSVCADMGQQLMELKDDSAMWKYLCDRYEGTANEQTKAMTKRQLYAQLESAKCKQNGSVEGHLNYMCRLKGRLKTIGMTLDDAVFSGVLVSPLPSNERFDRLGDFVDAGMDCVDTPEKVVALAITFAKANQADSKLNRAFSSVKPPTGQQSKQGGRAKESGGNEHGLPKGHGKARACFVCGSTEHLQAACPEKASKQSGGGNNEQKRKPRGNCTLRQDESEPSSPALNDEDVVGEGVVAGVATAAGHGTPREDALDDEHAAEAAGASWQGEDQGDADTGSAWWYFDTASNSHVTGRCSYFVSFTEGTSAMGSVRGLLPSIVARIAGVGTIALVNEVDGEQVVVYVDDVFYVPDAEYGLFSPGLAHEQGFKFDFDPATRNFIISREGRRVAVATPQEATWGFQVTHPSRGDFVGPEDRP